MIHRVIYKSIFTWALLAAMPLSVVFAKQGSLQIKGSDTMVNLVQAWAEAYMEKYPDLFIAVTGGGSGTGIATLLNGTCDVAMSSRNITPKEMDLAAKKGIAPKEYKVALDGLAVVVHPSNPVSELTLDELAGIFTGHITNWKDAGGLDQRIVVLSREVNSGTHVYFKEHVLRKGNSKSKEDFAADALLLPSSQAIADEITQNPAAIGYYGMGYIGKDHKAVSIAKDAGAEAVDPTEEDVISGRYPISRPLFIYTNGEPNEQTRRFLDFILSDEGQKIVLSMDFVPFQK